MLFVGLIVIATEYPCGVHYKMEFIVDGYLII